jgi:aminopeptidase YwaD
VKPIAVGLVLLLAAGASSTCPPAAFDTTSLVVDAVGGSGDTQPTAADVGKFSKKRAMKDVRHLAGKLGVRVRTSRAERKAARYIAQRFRSMGYNVNVQKFHVDDGVSRNVVAWWPGSRRYPFIVGGHLDTVPDSPGANDNASGVAVILENARLFAGTRQAEWVRFVAFGSEEYGTDGRHHVGSEKFVRRQGRTGRRRLPGMVSVDMVADGRPLIVGNSGIAEDSVAKMLYRDLKRAKIGVTYQTTCDCSDNGPFERAGIPAGFMYSGDEPDYHASTDTPANLKPRDLERSGRALRAVIERLDRKRIQRLRKSG